MGSSFVNQYLAIICGSICAIAYGASVGWNSAAFLILESADSPLDQGPLTVSEISWACSLIGLGGMAGTVVTGWICDKFGRRPGLLFNAFPLLANWLLIIIAKNAWYLYASRFLTGMVGGGVFAVVPLLVGEISEDSIRGTLGSIVTLFANVGVLVGFLAGTYLSYEIVPVFHLLLPIIFLGVYFFFPESPWFLIKNNKTEEAEQSLRFYRNITKNSSQEKQDWFELEFNKFKSSYQYEEKPTDADTKITLKDFVSKPVIMGMAIMIIHDFCGAFTLVNYTAKIFVDSGSDLPPNESAIIVGVIQLIGTYVSTILVDRTGRKTLFTFSCLGTGICLIILATFTYLSTTVGMDLSHIQWVPVVSFSATLFIASIGISPIPYVILGEIMPDKIRGPGTAICLLTTWFDNFVLMKAFPPLVEAYGLHNCIYFFALWCFVGVFYTVFYVPETKGRSLADIENSFKNPK